MRSCSVESTAVKIVDMPGSTAQIFASSTISTKSLGVFGAFVDSSWMTTVFLKIKGTA